MYELITKSFIYFNTYVVRKYICDVFKSDNESTRTLNTSFKDKKYQSLVRLDLGVSAD